MLAKGIKPPQQFKQLKATWKNTGKNPDTKNAEIWYDEGMFWGKLGHGDPPLKANTYKGHRWNARVDGTIIMNWTIEDDDEYFFEI